jgi:hypothetical protein
MAKSPGRPRKTPIFNRPVKDLEPPPLNVVDPKPNFDLLSAEEKELIREKARVNVEAKEKDRAWEAFLAAEVERIEKEVHPETYEEEKEITIDMAIFADRLIINGRHFMHGRKYTVKKSLYDSISDMMARGHRHYRDTHRDPARALMEAQQEIAKGGHALATLSASGAMDSTASSMLARRGQF